MSKNIVYYKILYEIGRELNRISITCVRNTKTEI